MTDLNKDKKYLEGRQKKKKSMDTILETRSN